MYIILIYLVVKLIRHFQPSLDKTLSGGNRERYNKNIIIEKYIDQMKQINLFEY